MNKFIVFFIVLVSLLFSINSCEFSTNNEESLSNTDSKEYSLQKNMEGKKFAHDKIDYYRETYTMEDVEQLAYSIAQTLKDKKVRKIFKNLQNNSKNSERIIELSSLLNFNYYDSESEEEKSFLKLIKKNIKKANKKNFSNKFDNLDFGLFDIYFPYPNHRNTWQEDQELIVAVINSCIGQGEEKVIAFNLDGVKLLIDPQREPEIPTLVVTPSEKYGNYEAKAAVGGGGTEWWDEYRTTLTEIYVRDQYDGGLCGEFMEIIVRYKIYFEDTGNYSGWSTAGRFDIEDGIAYSIDKQFISFPFDTYQFQLQIFEDDDWLCGNDDNVADNNWNRLYNINTYNPQRVLIDQNVTNLDLFYPKTREVMDVDNTPNYEERVYLHYKMQSVVVSN